MGSGIQRLQAFKSCRGPALVVGRLPCAPVARHAGTDAVLTLASILGEGEAQGRPARVVVLRVCSRDDVEWVARAIDWLAARGRPALVRTSVRLSGAVVEAACRWGATVVLELAHPRSDLQRALLGPGAESVSSLLLHAQHLRSRDIEVAARIGPLFPTLHDRSGAAASIMRHVAAADLRDAHLSIGQLGPGRLEALANGLPWADFLALARAFELPIPANRGWPVIGASSAHLPARAHAIFEHAMRRSAEVCGLRIDHCGCSAQCHLDPERVPAYVPLLTNELFSSETG